MDKAFNQSKFNKLKHIAVSEFNYKEIRKYGEFGDSFDDVMTRILNSLHLQKSKINSNQRTEGGI